LLASGAAYATTITLPVRQSLSQRGPTHELPVEI